MKNSLFVIECQKNKKIARKETLLLLLYKKCKSNERNAVKKVDDTPRLWVSPPYVMRLYWQGGGVSGLLLFFGGWISPARWFRGYDSPDIVLHRQPAGKRVGKEKSSWRVTTESLSFHYINTQCCKFELFILINTNLSFF